MHANCACVHFQSPEEPVPKRGTGAQHLSPALVCQGKPLGILLRLGVNRFDLDKSPSRDYPPDQPIIRP